MCIAEKAEKVEMVEKVEKVVKAVRFSDCQRCIISKSRGTIIDMLRPDTGRTWYCSETLEECRKRYPDAEEMSYDEFVAWKVRQQRTPVTWQETTRERFDEMLNVLPPAAMLGGGFLVGEPYDHDAGSGLPRFSAYRRKCDRYEVASRPMTRAEFRKEVY